MDATQDITRDELEHVLDLQQCAYETLLWLDNMALLRNDILDRRTADVLRETRTCMAWIERHLGQIPQRLRPRPDEAEPFARLFASFFQTSFRIEQRLHDGNPYYRIRASKDAADGAKRFGRRNVPKRIKAKRRAESDRMKLNAISEMNDGADCAAASISGGSIVTSDSFQRDLTMWTYARELVYRARAESHGPAAHLLWKEMDKTTRERLTATQIWNARERLQAAVAGQAIAT